MSSYTTTALFPEEEYRSMVLDKTGGTVPTSGAADAGVQHKAGCGFLATPLSESVGGVLPDTRRLPQHCQVNEG